MTVQAASPAAAARPIAPIDAPLPAEVGAGGLSRFALYQRFRAFTWPWFVRRALVFWPLAAAYGLFITIWHASAMTSWADALPMGWRGVVSCILVVSAGPALATAVRYLRLPYRVEVAGVLAALAVGLLVAHAANLWFAGYHAMLMAQHGSHKMFAPQVVHNVSQALGQLMGQAPHWFVLLLVGGAPDTLAYLSERRRLADYQRRRDLAVLRQGKADADLKLLVLQAQIEPHFLFNTLASVRSLIPDEPERAMAMVEALSEYLRSTLPRLRETVGMEASTLGEQVDICARYLDLMNIRMGERLTVTLDVHKRLRELAFPPLILISLVENAIKHGVEPKPGPVRIAIRARLTGEDALQVDVEDDGVGFGSGAGSGLGLANIREQLAHRFGRHAALAVETLPTGGVRARITVPADPA